MMSRCLAIAFFAFNACAIARPGRVDSSGHYRKAVRGVRRKSFRLLPAVDGAFLRRQSAARYLQNGINLADDVFATASGLMMESVRSIAAEISKKCIKPRIKCACNNFLHNVKSDCQFNMQKLCLNGKGIVDFGESLGVLTSV